MKRLFSLFLAIILAATFTLPALATNVEDYTDVADHWALPYIQQVTQNNLMIGEGTKFSPDQPMTRAMFVTVLGRFAKIEPNAWKMNYDGNLFSDVATDKYYSSYVNWAARLGITQGIGHGRFEPDGIITREQMLTILMRFANATGKTFLSLDMKPQSFTDEAEICDWAKPAVLELQGCGIIQGMPNEDGTCRFSPQTYATRAQAAAVFCRMQSIITEKPDWNESYATLLMLNETTLHLEKDKTATLTAQIFPASTTNQTICWFSSDPNVATVENGIITWISAGTCTIYAYSANGCKASCTVICDKPATVHSAVVENPITQDLSLASGNDSYYEKCVRIFDDSVADPRNVYTSEAAARQDIVCITVPVWDIDSNGQKYTRFFSIEVHKNIAATVDQIFREIYERPAQYPIHSLGGFRYEARSEHNCGLAIDINPNENYYCSPAGQALVGSFFSPDSNEYSIPVAGEIDQIFNKYGFTRGIYWHSGYKDYMHYSFFGT